MKTRRVVIEIAKYGVSAALLVVVYRLISVEQSVELFRRARYGILVFSFLTLLAGACVGTLSWYYVLRVRIPDVALRDVFASYWTGLFFNSFLPSSVGGDVIKAYRTVRSYREPGFVITSILVDRVINLLVLVSIGILASLLALKRMWLAGWWCGTVSVAVALAGFLSRGMIRRLANRRRDGPSGRMAKLAVPLLELAASPRHFGPVLLAALGSQFCKITQNLFVIHALHLSIPMGYAYFLIPVFGVVSAVPVSIGGLGVRELVAQGLANPLGVDMTAMAALSLGGHIMVMIANSVGVVPFLMGNAKDAGRGPPDVRGGKSIRNRFSGGAGTHPPVPA